MSKYDDIFLSTETIQDFIDKNNIKNKKDLQNRFGSIYNIFRKDPRKDNIIFPNPQVNYSTVTLDQVQNLIDSEGIKSSYEFHKKYRRLFRKCKNELHILDKLVFKRKPKNIFNHWKDIDTIEEFQQFINDNNIIGKGDFNKRFRGLWQKCRNKGFLNKLSFPKSIYGSSWEMYVCESIKLNLEIQNLEIQKQFTECIDKRPLPFDLYFIYNDRKILIEVQGPRHFMQIDYHKDGFNEDEVYKKFLICRKHDIVKNRFAKNNSIEIYYISLNTNLSNYDYPYYIYHNIDKLIYDIKNNQPLDM